MNFREELDRIKKDDFWRKRAEDFLEEIIEILDGQIGLAPLKNVKYLKFSAEDENIVYVRSFESGKELHRKKFAMQSQTEKFLKALIKKLKEDNCNVYNISEISFCVEI